MFASIRAFIIQLFGLFGRAVNAADKVVATAELHAIALHRETEIEINTKLTQLERQAELLLAAPAQ